MNPKSFNIACKALSDLTCGFFNFIVLRQPLCPLFKFLRKSFPYLLFIKPEDDKWNSMVKSSLSPVFMNKGLSNNSHTHSFIYCLWLLLFLCFSGNRDTMVLKAKYWLYESYTKQSQTPPRTHCTRPAQGRNSCCSLYSYTIARLTQLPLLTLCLCLHLTCTEVLTD